MKQWKTRPILQTNTLGIPTDITLKGAKTVIEQQLVRNEPEKKNKVPYILNNWLFNFFYH